jgi:hypothetical protein
MMVGVFLLFCVGFAIVGAVANAAKKGGEQDMAAIGFGAIFLMILCGAIFAMSFVFWMLFHAAVGRALGSASLVHQSYWYIALPFVYFVIVFALLAIIGVRSAQGFEPGPFALAMFSAFLMAMGLLVNGWYLSICWQTFRAMDLAGAARRD